MPTSSSAPPMTTSSTASFGSRWSPPASACWRPSVRLQSQTAAAAQPDTGRLTERLAGLAAMPPAAGPAEAPIDLDEPSMDLAANDIVQEPSVWRAPGNVTIEKRPAQATGIALPRTPAPARPAAPQQNFQPAPPAAIKRPVRRMPNVEELPIVAQKAIKAQNGEAPPGRSCRAEAQGRLPGAAGQCRPRPQGQRCGDAVQARARIRPARSIRDPAGGRLPARRRRGPRCRPPGACGSIGRGSPWSRSRRLRHGGSLSFRPSPGWPGLRRQNRLRQNHTRTTTWRFPRFCAAGRTEAWPGVNQIAWPMPLPSIKWKLNQCVRRYFGP